MNRFATIAILLTILGAATPAAADLERDIRDREGLVHVAAPVRPGVRGDHHTVTIGEYDVNRRDAHDGLVHLIFEMADGRVVDLDVRSGGRSSARERRATDLGTRDAAEVAALCVDLMQDHPDEDVAETAVAAVAIADDDNWQPLLALARDRDRDADVREAAIFWLGVGAGDKMAAELVDIAEDDHEQVEVREHAVFALSQALEDDPERAVATLGGIATSHGHPDVRRSALFWLAQHDDPRVLDLFESILLD
jgi:HEAT repeat protein